MKTVFLFPGQGAQYPGMGRDLWESSRGAKALFAEAGRILGFDAERLLFEGSEEELRATDKAQGAITLVNLAAALVLKERGVSPAAAAGFSLGEYAALAAAGVLPPEDVLALVKVRGDLMEKASRKLDSPEGNAGMAAVLGLDYPEIAKAIAAAGIPGLFASNYNSPAQTVVSGTARALSDAETVLKAAGAKRVIRLKVSGPFHSPLLAEAREAFEKALEGFKFADPGIPLYSNVTGRAVPDGKTAKKLCGEQITSPVLWVDIERAVRAAGADRVFETGPGTVLCGLWKAVFPEFPCKPAGKLSDLEGLEAKAEEQCWSKEKRF